MRKRGLLTGEQRAGLSALLPKAAAPEVSRRAKARIGARPSRLCRDVRLRPGRAGATAREGAPARLARQGAIQAAP